MLLVELELDLFICQVFTLNLSSEICLPALHRLNSGYTFLLSATKDALFVHFPQVGVATEIDRVERCAQCLPVKLSDSLETLEVVLEVGRVLLCHDFDIMRLLRVVSLPKKEDEPLSLEWLEFHVSQIEEDLGNAVPIVEIVGVVLTQVTRGVPLVERIEDEVGRVHPHLLLNLGLGA